MFRYRARNSTPVELVAGPRPSQLGSETDTLPSVREQEHDDNTSPSDDNVFESPPSTLETRVQVNYTKAIAFRVGITRGVNLPDSD